MPSEPDSSIEQQLEAYAERRKAEATDEDFKLHPVTRNSLKVEIVKQYGRPLPGATQRESLWSTLWPKIAIAGGGVFVLAAAFLIFRPDAAQQGVQQIALNEDVAETDGAPVEAKNVAMLESEITTLQVPAPNPSAQPTRSFSASEFTYQFYAVRTSGATARERSAIRSDTAIPTDSANLVVPSQPKRPPPSRESASASRNVVDDSNPMSSSPAPTIVLASFQFRLDGDRVTVVDQDQSEYSGRILPINPATLPGSMQAIDQSVLGDSSDPKFPANYRLYSQQGGRAGAPAAGQFTVEGTNRTSGKQISFTGRMLTWTQAEPATSSATIAGPQSVIQIQGTAAVSGEPPLSVNATTNPQ